MKAGNLFFSSAFGNSNLVAFFSIPCCDADLLRISDSSILQLFQTSRKLTGSDSFKVILLGPSGPLVIASPKTRYTKHKRAEHGRGSSIEMKIQNYSIDNFKVFKVTIRLLTIVDIPYQGKNYLKSEFSKYSTFSLILI